MHDFSKNAANMWVQPLGHPGQQETLSELQCSEQATKRKNFMKSSCRDAVGLPGTPVGKGD